MASAVSVSRTDSRSRTATTPALTSDVGAVAPVQNLNFRVVGSVRVPANAMLILSLNVVTPESAMQLTSLSMVTVPPESPLTVTVKDESLFASAKDPA